MVLAQRADVPDPRRLAGGWYRLPLDSIPWVAKSDYPFEYPQDPWDARGPLPDYGKLVRQRSVPGAPRPLDPRGFIHQTVSEQTAGEQTAGERPAAVGPPVGDGRRERRRVPRCRAARQAAGAGGGTGVGVTGAGDPSVIRTALCTQARGGVLLVFLPPQRTLEDFLDLVAAVEDTAERLRLPVLVEGYPPPHDPRVNVLKVTPDPGVIEVNTQPVESWTTSSLTPQPSTKRPALARLATEKFMLDGRHTGTGGGNAHRGRRGHAEGLALPPPARPAQKPGRLLAQPPVAVVLCSAGSSSGRRRRHRGWTKRATTKCTNSKLAFAAGARTGRHPAVAGRPHFPQHSRRHDRQHAPVRVLHRQALLARQSHRPPGPVGNAGVRDAAARPHEPDAAPAAAVADRRILEDAVPPAASCRWRTEIHDRFLLPHFVRQDLADVTFDLNDAGYAFDLAWFDPHVEFRFPHYGTVQQRDLRLELRQAIEPWNVLGEEQTAGGTSRYVDSSVERLQVKVSGMTDLRHVITCNGTRVPLRPTGTNGEFVAGVRYRAWSPPNALHPTVPVQTPLVFDVIDTWNGRSVGGCTYHVLHPGGRNYATFPVNSYEAEGRRISRFTDTGHTPGRATIREPRPNPEFPFTLDLRRG